MSIKLNKTEHIVYIARRHGIVYFQYWILTFVFITVPFFFMFWLFNHGWWGQTIFFVSSAIGLFFLARTIFLWKKNIGIITTHRVIDIDQKGFFDKLVSEMPYNQLDHVSGRIKGFWGTIWRYGIVSIQNENGNSRIVLDSIRQPVYVQQKINEARQKYNTMYLNNSICPRCEEKKTSVYDILVDGFKKMKIGELLKIKRTLNEEIKKTLRNDDN